MEFRKYHALGNDYVVLGGAALGDPPDRRVVHRVCDRHHGIGADGILLDVPCGIDSDACADFDAGAGEGARAGADVAAVAAAGAVSGAAERPRAALRIFNPDGSEAEKSGNGLRIFARYLRDRGRVSGTEWFTVKTAGGDVACSVSADGRRVAAEMGRASFDAAAIPVTGGEGGEVLLRPLEVEGREVECSAVTVGNPHCVVVVETARAEEARSLGPLLERHPAFPNRTNVQLVEVVGPHRIRIEIWERGAGYTLASGTSSCAAAAVCRRLGRVRSPVVVAMPGGEIDVAVRDDYSLRMEGAVTAVAHGVLSPECLEPKSG